MDESDLWTWGTLAGLALLGAAIAGALYAAPPSFVKSTVGAETLIGGLLFLILFLAPGLAMQLYRRGYDYSTLVGGAGGALFTLALFGTLVGLSFLQQAGSLDVKGAIMLVGVAPLLVGALCAGGTLFLARGVQRYRAENGLKHAPR